MALGAKEVAQGSTNTAPKASATFLVGVTWPWPLATARYGATNRKGHDSNWERLNIKWERRGEVGLRCPIGPYWGVLTQVPLGTQRLGLGVSIW